MVSLPNGLTLENIKNVVTAKRNPIIVNALNKAGFIENYASGVRRIFKDYLGFEKQPEYNISDNAVIVSLYNMNYDTKNVGKNDNDRLIEIIKIMANNKHITIIELSKIFKVTTRTIE